MYNAFIANRKSIEIIEVSKKSEANKKYIKKYYNNIRPNLIDNHNKRINSFIRRMEDQPIQINIDPYRKDEKQLDSQRFHKDKRRAHSNLNSLPKDQSSKFDDYQVDNQHVTFKFKDNEDWKSLFTPFQRLERQKNFELFKQKYGDPTVAYRSIGSQSQYKVGHQFRNRNKNLEINPPMRYTNKPTQQILANFKSKYLKKTKEKNIHLSINEKQQQQLVRKNTGSSISGGMNEDILLSDNNSQQHKISKQNLLERQNSQQKINDEENHNNRPLKLHFKEIIDLQQHITDGKTKRALKQILYKCGVYKRKNRRAITDSEVDQLSQFTDGR